MKHFAIHELSKIQSSLLPKVSDRLCCGNVDSAVYYYHSDHLGSASWITNKTGNPVQHLQYMPYGEPLVNEKTTSYEERFTFTGKERDSETGFSYFGARYYDSDLMTGWLSVDPLADKYPNISPYAYCAWNPVKLVDPDGRDVWLPGGDLYSPNMKTEGYDHDDAVTIQALNEIYKSEEGKLMIDEICNSNISVSISMTNGKTKYEVNGPKEAFFDSNTNTKGTGKDIIMEISWNYQNPETLPTLNGMEANATFNLLDEICHAYDYSMGNSDNSEFRLGCKKSEFQAVYRSNVVRHQLGNTNYRTHYLVTKDNTKGYGPTTAKTGIFYCPSWYGRTSTDKFSMIKEY